MRLALSLVLWIPSLALAQAPLLPVETLLPAYGSGGEFGVSVAVGESWIAVGAPQTYDRGNQWAGAVYLYQWRENAWVLEERLTPPVSEANALFGTYVALHGNTLAVSSQNLSRPSAKGSVDLYQLEGTWTHILTLLPHSPDLSFFARDIALEDTTLVVGTAPRGTDAISQAYIYSRRSGDWALRDSLQASPETRDFSYGEFLDISGNRIAISNRRVVEVFERSDNGTWKRDTTLSQGVDFDLRGDRLIFGDVGHRNPDNAAAYLYEWNGTEWIRAVLPLPSSEDDSRELATLTGNGAYAYIRRSSRRPDETLAEYRREESGWVLGDTTQITPGNDIDLYGEEALVAHGEIVAIGWTNARVNRQSTGAVTVYRAGDEPEWHVLTAASRPTDQLFGDAVSRDGNRLAVAALAATSVYILGPDGPQLEGEVAGGNTVVLDGSRLVVGNRDSRSASTYELANGTWSSTGQLRGNDSFGASVALDGNHLLVGTPGTGAGRGYIDAYTFDGRTWQTTTRIVSPDSVSGDLFGTAIDLDDGLAVIGAPGRRRANNAYGDAYVFEAIGGRWALATALAPPSDGRIGEFGRTVAIDGGHILVGAPLSVSRSPQSGTVYGYQGLTWRHSSTIIGPEDHPSFGATLALDGNRAVIGAPRDGSENDGTAFVYVNDGQQWAFSRQLAPAEGKGGAFGSSVDLSGRSIAVGAPLDSEIGPSAGSAYLFEDAFPINRPDAPVQGQRLSAAFPNPADHDTHLTLTLDAPERIHVEVFDALGRSVLPTRSHLYGSGTHTLVIESGALPAGVYMVRVTSSETSDTRRFTRAR